MDKEYMATDEWEFINYGSEILVYWCGNKWATFVPLTREFQTECEIWLDEFDHTR